MLDAIAELKHITSGPRPLSETDLLRLVVLRHEIGAKSIRNTPSPLPPAPAKDLFPGMVGAPEISGAELTAAHVASGLRHHGALVVRGLVAPADVARLCGLIDGRDWSKPLVPTDEQGQPSKGSAPMQCSAAALQGLVESYHNAGMDAVMTEYLGEAPVLLSERLQIDRQIIRSGLSWHQDGAFFGRNVGGVNSFLALDNCGSDVPGLSVVTRRLDEIIGVEHGQRANLGYANAFRNKDVLALAGTGRVITPVLGPGDAIFIDEMTMHRTAAPRSNPRPHSWAIAWFFALSRYLEQRHPLNSPRPRSWAITWFFSPSRFPEQRHPLWFGQ
jgi:hypothetical protein